MELTDDSFRSATCRYEKGYGGEVNCRGPADDGSVNTEFVHVRTGAKGYPRRPHRRSRGTTDAARKRSVDVSRLLDGPCRLPSYQAVTPHDSHRPDSHPSGFRPKADPNRRGYMP